MVEEGKGRDERQKSEGERGIRGENGGKVRMVVGGGAAKLAYIAG